MRGLQGFSSISLHSIAHVLGLTGLRACLAVRLGAGEEAVRSGGPGTAEEDSLWIVYKW